MNDRTRRSDIRRGGEVVVFWSWIAVLTAGLAYMILVPLSGR